ncbi:MAG: hypothetical protein AB7P40_02890 [Chloroflexota bacterium]
MSIRLKLWLGAMACAAVLLVSMAALTGLLVSRLAPDAAPVPGPTMLLAGGVILIVFAPIAWLLVWLAYAPVREVTRTARRIVLHHQLDSRCFYPGPLDDVGRLVVVMNEVLVRYDAALARILRLRAATTNGASAQEATPQDAADLVLDIESHPASQAPQPGH